MRHLPNTITLINLICGSAAIITALHGQYLATVGWLAGAAVADFADGLVARALRVTSPVGKELDSLADVVSFGVAPAMILYSLLTPDTKADTLYLPGIPVFILAAFSALRLARFNLDERQHEHFIGLPTPASTLLVVGLLLLYLDDTWNARDWMTQPATLYLIAGVLSFLLVAGIPMFSFKFKHWGWKGNAERYSFAVTALLLLVIWRQTALAPIMILYILINLGRMMALKSRSAQRNSSRE
jgi:CDP-diacylglycerol--serine O-phosphatidyltransferase